MLSVSESSEAVNLNRWILLLHAVQYIFLVLYLSLYLMFPFKKLLLIFSWFLHPLLMHLKVYFFLLVALKPFVSEAPILMVNINF